MEISSAVEAFNEQGVEGLSADEVVVIGDAISLRLSRLKLPGLESIVALAADSSYAEAIDRTASVSQLNITFKEGTRMVELRGDSGIGKSGAETCLRMSVINKLGLHADSQNPDSVKRLIELAIRYAALKGVGK